MTPNAVRSLLLFALAGAGGCSATEPSIHADLAPGPLRTALLYIPNRVVDLTDIPRAGVELGPGIGVDAMVTDYLRIAAVKRWSKGIGYQTFRHSPLKDSEEERLIFGPADLDSEVTGTPWLMDPWDVRLELHLLIVGAHVALNLGEIYDFAAGILTFDPRGDDIQ